MMKHLNNISIKYASTARMALVFLALFVAFSLPVATRAENRVVKAGIFNFDGYHMKDEEGLLSGFGIDVLKLISEYSHLIFDYTGYDKSWRESQRMLKDGEIDILTSARRTPEREEIFAFSLPLGKNYTQLTTSRENTKLRGGDYSTYEGMKIGVLADSTQNTDLREFAEKKGFNYTPKVYDTADDLEHALYSGEVDAILSSNLRKTRSDKVLDVIKADNFYAIVRKEDQDLLNEINYAIEQMNENEGNWDDDLFFRYYGPTVSPVLEFTEREKNFADQVGSGQKEIIAIARGDMAPYSYVENGELQGILPDFFRKVMEQANLPFKFIIPKDRKDYFRLANGDLVDVVLDRIRPDYTREDSINQGFATKPYMTTGLAMVTRQDHEEEPRKIGLVNQSILHVNEGLLRNIDKRRYDSAEEALDAVKKGEVDAAYVFPYAAQRYINHDPDNALTYTMMNDKGASFRMFVPQSKDHELISILNKSIKALPEGTLDQLLSRHTALAMEDMTPGRYLRAHPDIVLMLAGAFFLVLASALYFYINNRWNKRILTITENSRKGLEEQLAVVEALSRDYVNVFSINEHDGTAKILKLGGYITKGLKKNTSLPQAYGPLLATYIRDRVHPEDKAAITEALALETVREKATLEKEYTGAYRILENGESHHYQFTFVRLGEKAGLPNSILAGFRNIDEVISREQEKKAVLAEALEEAKRANKAKTAFLNSMSHDMRTPMNAIIGFTSLAKDHVENSPLVNSYLAKIMISGNHLLNLINDVLDMSRIESGKILIEEKETSLAEMLGNLRDIAQADIRNKQLNFRLDAENVLNERVFCDPLKLNQVLLNMLGNAIKYTPAGGSVQVRLVQESPAIDGFASYQFRVKDSGIGMSREFLKHVFEPFEREQTSTVSGIQGTGLGLAITKKLVEIMGGEISVESEPGQGTEFIVRFHLRVMDDGQTGQNLPELQGQPVLVVESDPDSADAIAGVARRLGLAPDIARNGEEAIRLAASGKDYPLCLIARALNDMKGIALAEELKGKVPENCRMILLSARDWADIEEQARQAGIAAFCPKPVFLSVLREVLAGQTRQKAEVPAISPEEFAGKRLLLAEDNEMNQEIAQMILEDAGFRLDIVDNGQKAVERIRELPAGTYDAVLMDVQMPVMNGYDATRKIRALTESAKARVPIIAMTANAFAEDRQEALGVGMDGYVSKPIEIEALMRTLAEILRNNKKS